MAEGFMSTAPDWFMRSIEQPAETGSVDVESARIEWFAWGRRGDPGLLLVPGNSAHAGWWRFIAPFFSDRFRVATLSWSGMGGSDWRDLYAPRLFAREALAVAHTAGLHQAAVKTVIVGHSFGGMVALVAATIAGDRLRRAIMVDARVRPREVWRVDPAPDLKHRIYPTRSEALARFHLRPLQPTANGFIVDWLALSSVGPAAGEGGWTWRFDPNLRLKTDLGDIDGIIGRAGCPLAFIRGGLSTIVTDAIWADHQAQAPSGTPFVDIPEAGHHVMVDQPLALVAALRALIALSW
jgi:pimeloyl-ACP methyl ester carboxylesterase